MKVAIIGAGKLGSNLVEALLGGQHEICLVDNDEAVIARAASKYDVLTLCDNPKRSSVLQEMGIENYDILIACTEKDEKNIFIASLAKKMGCKQTFARVRGPEHLGQLDMIEEFFDIDRIFNPDYACASEIYKSLTQKFSLEGGHFTIGSAEILEFDIEKMPVLVGKKLAEAAPLLPGMLVAAVSRGGKIIIPNGTTTLTEEDKLYVIGQHSDIKAIRGKVSERDKSNKLKHVMIAGGGKTAYYLAELFGNIGSSVKIIEQDIERCEFLSERLENALIVHGNASDTDLLQEENFTGMDAFITATGLDEENILLALMAQKKGIREVVAKVSRNNFSEITDEIDNIMTVNPVDMCTSVMLRSIGNKDSVVFSQMIQGQAEFIEVWAEEDTPITQAALAELEIPEGILIAAVNRGKQVIIPRGNTKILPGDKVVILSMLASTPSLPSLVGNGRQHTL